MMHTMRRDAAREGEKMDTLIGFGLIAVVAYIGLGWMGIGALIIGLIIAEAC